MLVVTRLFPDVNALGPVRRQLPALVAFTDDAAVGVEAKTVDAITDFFETLVNVDAVVAVVGKSVTFGTLAHVSSGYVLAFSWAKK